MLVAAQFATSSLAAQFEYQRRVPLLKVAQTSSGVTTPPTTGGTPPSAPTTSAAQLSVSSASLAFGSLDLGQSATYSVLVTNSGGSTFTFANAPAVSGNGYSASSDCGATLAAGASCQVSVSFSPTAAGSSAGTLSLDGTASNAPVAVSLSGVGVQRLAISRWADTNLDFGAVMVGSSATRELLLYNEGNQAADFSQLPPLPAGVTAHASACSNVTAGSACSVTFVYAPTAATSYLASAFVPSQGQHANALTVTGQGLQTAVDLSTHALSFGNQAVGSTSTAKAVAILNTGNAPVTIGALNVSGVFSATSDCGSALAVGASCVVNVTFSPADGGSASGSLTLGTGAGTQTVALSGFGAIALTAALSSSWNTEATPNGNFASASVGASSTLTTYVIPAGNVGALSIGATLSGSTDFRLVSAHKIHVYSSGGSPTIETLSCGATVTTGSIINCTADSSTSTSAQLAVTVQFTPSSAGAKTANLSITHNGSNASPLVLSLAGTGLPPVYTLHLDGAHNAVSTTDSTGSTWTATGAAKLSTAKARAGTASMAPSGSNTGVFAGPAIALPSGDWTVEAWVYPTASSTDGLVVGQYVYGDSARTGWGVMLKGTVPYLCGNFSAWSCSNYAAGSLALNTWSHVAVTRASGTVRMFVNGVATGSGTLNGASLAGTTAATLGGYAGYSGTAPGALNAYVDEVVIDTSQARYTGAFTPTPAASTLSATTPVFVSTTVGGNSSTATVRVTNSGASSVALTSVTSSATDFVVTDASACTSSVLLAGAGCNVSVTFTPTTTGARTGTLTIASDASNPSLAVNLSGTAYSTSLVSHFEGTVIDSMGHLWSQKANLTYNASGWSGQALALNGSSSTLSYTATGSEFTFGTGDFTLEAWVNPTNYSYNGTYGRAILDLRPDAVNGTYPAMHIERGSGVLTVTVNSTAVVSGNAAVPLNTWSHVAWSRNSGVSRLYLNGVLTASFADTYNYGNPGTVKVGTNAFYSAAPTAGFAGLMDEVRVIKGQGLYPAAFTVPTAAFDDVTATTTAGGYTWSRPSGVTLSQANAAVYCSSLTGFGGGWRLPSRAEAMTVYSDSTNRAALVAAGWPNTTYAWMWASSAYNGSAGYVWRTDATTAQQGLASNTIYESFAPVATAYPVSCVK